MVSNSVFGDSMSDNTSWHGTTILSVRKNGKVVVAGDGQVSLGQTVIKANKRKVRSLGDGSVIGGFAGATADAFNLFERPAPKLDPPPGQLIRAAVQLAQPCRQQLHLRRPSAMLDVSDDLQTIVCSTPGGSIDLCLRRAAIRMGGY